VPAADDDWRLRDQERYLKGAVLVWREWSPPPASDMFDWGAGDRSGWESADARELPDEEFEPLDPRGWDQDHCDFCWGAFSAPALARSDPDSLTAGYTLHSAKRSSPWVCPRCFEDFRERFDWKVATAGSQSEPPAPSV
jgi:hypothetical protein